MATDEPFTGDMDRLVILSPPNGVPFIVKSSTQHLSFDPPLELQVQLTPKPALLSNVVLRFQVSVWASTSSAPQMRYHVVPSVTESVMFSPESRAFVLTVAIICIPCQPDVPPVRLADNSLVLAHALVAGKNIE
jgi:hypothetical protein